MHFHFHFHLRDGLKIKERTRTHCMTIETRIVHIWSYGNVINPNYNLSVHKQEHWNIDARLMRWLSVNFELRTIETGRTLYILNRMERNATESNGTTELQLVLRSN